MFIPAILTVTNQTIILLSPSGTPVFTYVHVRACWQKSKLATKRSSAVKNSLATGAGIVELKIAQAKDLVAADSNGRRGRCGGGVGDLAATDIIIHHCES